MKKTLIGLIVAVAALALAGLAVADSKKFKTSTTIVVTPVAGTTKVTYSGQISSPKQACIKNRRVFFNVPDGTLTSTHSDSTGAWSTAPVSQSSDLAGVTKKTLSSNPKHKKVCKLYSTTNIPAYEVPARQR